MKIVLMEDLGVSPGRIEKEAGKLRELGHEFAAFSGSSDLEEQLKQTEDADVIILANMPMSEKLIENNPNLKFIDVAFTGYDHIPTALAASKGIAVSNASGYATDAVAEAALWGMLDQMRHLDDLQDRCRDGKSKAGIRGRLLKGKTVGIIGAGAIGKAAARLAKAFGAEIVGYARRKITDPVFDRQLDLDDLLEQSDVVSLHVPLTEQTRGLIGKEQLQNMKKDAILVNTARGPVVDQRALAEALEKGEIGGAYIDVFDAEPPLQKDLPILQAKNCTVTPHIGFDSQESMDLRADIVFDNLYSWLEGNQKNKIC